MLSGRVPGDYDPASDTIKVMTMKVSKGLEFPIVALPGVGHMPAAGEDETEAARVSYPAAGVLLDHGSKLSNRSRINEKGTQGCLFTIF